MYSFIKYQTELKIYFNYICNFKKTFYKDSKFIKKYLRLVVNIKKKYDILNSDFHNFDEIYFII